MPDQKFIKDAQALLAKQQEQNELSAKQQLHAAEVLKAEGPEMWHKLVDSIRTTVDEINKPLPNKALQMTEDPGGIRLVRLVSPQKEIKVSVNQHSFAFSYNASGLAGSFVPSVLGNGLEYRDRQEIPNPIHSNVVSVDDMTTKIIRAVVV